MSPKLQFQHFLQRKYQYETPSILIHLTKIAEVYWRSDAPKTNNCIVNDVISEI